MTSTDGKWAGSPRSKFGRTVAIRVWVFCLAALVALPGCADDAPRFEFGGDVFEAGRAVTHDSVGTDDLFMAGDSVIGAVDITGSAHLAGRSITMEGRVGGDAYVAGEEIDLQGHVTGDATLLGRMISVAGVGGDLRLAGSEIRIAGPVGGSAMIAGETVEIDATIAGDISLAAREIVWGEDAGIMGDLILYETEPGNLDVPARVTPVGQIERRKIDEWEGPQPIDWRRAMAGFLMGVIAVAAIAALIAALVPERLAEMRREVLERPFRTLWLGFLTQSALIGSAVLFAMTLIGLFLTPASIAIAVLVGFAGYVIGAYAFGVGLLLAFGRDAPDSIGDRALAAGVGALVAGVIGLIPFLGWVFVLALVLAGVGALTVRVVRPAFFTARS